MDTHNQLERSPPGFSGFYMGSLLPIVEALLNRTAPTAPRSGELRVKEKKRLRKDRGERRKREEGDETPCP